MLAGSRSEHTYLRISLSMLSLSWSMKVDTLVLVVVDVEYPVFSLTHSSAVRNYGGSAFHPQIPKP